MEEYKELEETKEKIYDKLAKNLTDEQLSLLGRLIDVEIELESYCNV